jgi:galactokinase
VIGLDVADGTVTPTSLPTGCAVLVVDSGVPRTLEGSPWVTYRAETLATAARLGRGVLRGVPPEAVADDPRGRHVVSEIDRAQQFLVALAADDAVAAGSLMVASHRSSRDDFGSSTAELDLLVDRLLAEGAYGARLTGGGFGGCVVALVAREDAGRIAERVVAHAAAATGREVRAHLVSPAPGVRALS